MTTSVNPPIRLATVELIEHLLRQGLINPMETVPYLLALQGDVGEPEIRSLALKCLIREGEKRPDMLRQRVCAGVKRAYIFQRIIHPEKKHVTAVVQHGAIENINGKQHIKEVACIFGPIFKESIVKNKAQRKGLFKSLLSLFTQNAVADDRERKATSLFASDKVKIIQKSFVEEIPLLSYASQILAHLPYETYLDPLFIIYHISCITAVQGAQLLDRLSEFLQPHNLGHADDVDNSTPDNLELSATEGNDIGMKKATDIMATEIFDMKQFSEMIAEASALTLLLRLKMFFKKVYALSEAKCIEYNPNNHKERFCDNHISLPERMPIFNNRIESFFMDDDETIHNKESLIRQYAEFRCLMRSGDVGISDLTLLSDKRKDSGGDVENGLKRRKKQSLNVTPSNSDGKKKKNKKRKRRKIGEDDSDSDDDYDE
mmetsp:Transcript_54628/g.65862  ORF Transcript_54628/g.65862 Transcript_54628/m.65862 type:complete len:431 (-) Transcript_54628:175-1467(-)